MSRDALCTKTNCYEETFDCTAKVCIVTSAGLRYWKNDLRNAKCPMHCTRWSIVCNSK